MNTPRFYNRPEAYFLYHSIGQYPGKDKDLAAAMVDFSKIWGACNDGQWEYAFKKRERFIDLWRGLINAPENSVTTSQSVTAALFSLIGSLPEKYLKGKRVLVAADCFPSLHFLLSGMQARFGFTLETVALRDGASWVEEADFLESWGKDVGLALVTWVTSTASARQNLERLVKHGRAMGGLIGVDITQAAGLLHFDVQNPGFDFAVSTSLKWMCGTPGAGILYVDKELIQECRPILRGWFSQDDPFSWHLDRFAFAPDIRRFDNGTPGIMGAVASVPALEWHSGQNQQKIIDHNRSLLQKIIEHADALGLPLLTPRDEKLRGGSIMLRMNDAAQAAAIVGALRVEGISTDCRDQVFRLSPGIVTSEDGVDMLFDMAAKVLKV